MQQRVCDQLLTPAEMEKVACQVVAPGMGYDKKDDTLRSKFQKIDAQGSTGPRGKENQDPTLTGSGTEVESGQVIEQEPQRKRPLPRPLPELVVNILQTNKKVMSSAPDDARATTDSTVSLDRSTAGKEQESSCTDGEPGRPLPPAGERSYLIGPRGRRSGVIKCGEVACHKDSGESDESLRSSNSTKKMRFDPTAGEEGKFYYTSDLENTVCESIHGPAMLRAEDEDRKLQSQEPSIEHACNGCSKRPTRKTVERACVKKISRKHSFDGMASTDDGTIVLNREKPVVAELGLGRRDEEISTLVDVTDEDYELATPARTIRVKNNSARQRSSSILCSRHVHSCVKCSSLTVSRLPRHRMKEWNERERRPNYGTDEACQIPSLPTHFLSYSRSTNPAKCARCSCLLDEKLTRKSTANWKTTETETDGYSSEGDMKGFQSKAHSEKKKLVRGGKHIHQIYTRRVEALGHTRREGSRQLITGALVDENISEPRVIPYDTSGEDTQLSPQSNASGECSPPVRSIASNVHGRKVGKVGERYDNKGENVALEDEADHRSEPNIVLQVNHEKAESLLQSETQYSESLKCSLVDEKVLEPKMDRTQAREDNSSEASAKGALASQCPPQAEMQVISGLKSEGETPITLPNLHCKVPIPKRRIDKSKHKVSDDECAEQADVEAEKRNANVEDLLGRFIRSNAECAAELIKCFQSKTSTNPSGGPHSSKMISKQKAETEGKPNQSEEPKQRDNKFHQPIGKTTFKQLTSCTGCLAILKPEVIGSLASRDGLEVKDTEVLCVNCSTSRALLKNPELVSSETQAGGKNPPSDPRTSTNILNDNSKLYDTSSGGQATNCLRRAHDCNTSTAAAEANESKVEETEDWQIGLLDISLFHLVNDLEVDETEYWNQINTPTIEENTDIRKYDSRRKRMVLEKGRASTISRRCHPREHTNAKTFS